MRSIWLIFAQTVTVLVAAVFVVATFRPQWLQQWSPRQILPEPTVSVAPAPSGSSPSGGLVSFREAARQASPAVVSIVTSSTAASNPHMRDPWFRYFFGDRQAQPQSGVGSGVIVSPEGYILTNNHVVEGADEIEVTLTDSRRSRASVIGTDPDTDLAILKIELDKLPVITLGNSDGLAVGDQVLAIGNPFGVGQTVTSGIVSALGRSQLGINTFENFIQTDAAINPGNSGGALVDTSGHLMGINTAIYSRSGGSLGIGFAIPVSIARSVLEQIVASGEVVRGWVGVEIQDLTPELAESFGYRDAVGALIAGVLRGSPADRGGVRPGDVLIALDGQSVRDPRAMLDMVAALPPGKSAVFRVRRGTEELDLKVDVGRRPIPAANR